MEKDKNILIIGGGIAGLATAYYLKKGLKKKGVGSCRITLIEKGSRLGGNIITERLDGFLIEGGPDCFLSEKPWALALCRELGLEEELLPTKKPSGTTYVYSYGRLHPLPEGIILMVPTKVLPLIRDSLISWRGKLRMAMEPFIPKRKETADESLAEFVRRRLGEEVLQKIAQPLVAGIHAGDPETMSVRASFPKFVEMEEKYGSLVRGMLHRMKAMRSMAKKKDGKGLTMFVALKSGMQLLVDTLIDRIKGDVTILKDTAVNKVEKEDDHYTVETESGESLRAHALVVATPAWVAAELLEALDEELSGILKSIPYVSTATVSLGYERDRLSHPMDGFGFVVPEKEGRTIMAATWTSSKWEGRAPEGKALIRCFVGGAKRGELVHLDDAELIRLVKKDLSDIMGIEEEPLFVRIYRWHRAMPQYTIGHIERVETIERLCASYSGLYLTGSAYHGIGISDTVREAESTAEKVIATLLG